MKILEQMTREVVTADPDDRVARLRQTLVVTGLRCLPVVAQGKLLGLIFARDLEAAPPTSHARDLMHPASVTVSARTPIERAAALMLEHQIHGLPVVNADNELQGVLTVSDLLRTLVKAPPISLWV
ncbi:CBS domain-containing protein [Deinococcus irradiatisoli]|uniref:CBS domain-containing protein n=1 Tax=Deinococcus irradiatisoli TaxID=2202254 RepID=A0A2Z3JUX1_9DEIO|nr:CBS domain-containing protein [Deinococcus irradiatisoli]AWN24314.1 CBS domain-containing protein [Deinococcus irradiatisoli]